MPPATPTLRLTLHPGPLHTPCPTLTTQCPLGHVNIDSFRVYETMEAGAIPVTLSENPKAPGLAGGYWPHVFGVDEAPIPFIATRTWLEAVAQMQELLKDKQALEERRKKVRGRWAEGGRARGLEGNARGCGLDAGAAEGQAGAGGQAEEAEGRGGKLVLTLILKRPAPCRYTSCGCGTRSGRRARCARGWCASWMAMAGVNLYSF